MLTRKRKRNQTEADFRKLIVHVEAMIPIIFEFLHVEDLACLSVVDKSSTLPLAARKSSRLAYGRINRRWPCRIPESSLSENGGSRWPEIYQACRDLKEFQGPNDKSGNRVVVFGLISVPSGLLRFRKKDVNYWRGAPPIIHIIHAQTFTFTTDTALFVCLNNANTAPTPSNEHSYNPNHPDIQRMVRLG